MTRIKKYALSTGIIVLFILSTIYYINTKIDANTRYEVEEQNNIMNIQSYENSATSITYDNTEVQITANMEADDSIVDSSIFQNKIYQNDEVKINELIKRYYDNELDIKILSSTNQEVIDQRRKLITRKNEIIQNYKNIKNYIKPGLSEDTYIVFTTYSIKMKNIDVLVPGMSVLAVVKNEISGDFLVNVSPKNEELNDYIKEVAESDDIKEIVEKVNRELYKTIKKDASLKELVGYLKDIS